MARRKPQEEHLNHEAWAIPYGDLITLLLAFFVVMYSISSINEGKFRVLSDAMIKAFNGAPKTILPVRVGAARQRGGGSDMTIDMTSTRALVNPIAVAGELHTISEERRRRAMQHKANGMAAAGEAELAEVAQQIEEVLADLIRDGQIRIRRGPGVVEVEIAADILFPSGSAAPTIAAAGIIQRVAELLSDLPNPVRVEGHTDDRPIRTTAFPSNWELSAGRAAGIVQLLAGQGIAYRRLSIHGFADQRPIADNTTADGRNANRRVTLVLVASAIEPSA